MNLFQADKVMDRLNQMIENAMAERQIEQSFDETKMSALETKLSKYLAINHITKLQLAEEKAKINQLISDISHQTKVPIANILLYSQLLEESELPKKEKECLGYLVEQAEKLNFLIASLVKASRLETGSITVFPKDEKIQVLFDKVMNQNLLKAKKKQLTLSCETSQEEASFDLKWTTEAVCNLVDNAIKYTKEGGSIFISSLSYSFFHRIDIADNGMGIENSEINKIFLRFYRCAAASKEEGMGLGLYLAREIIRNQGGYIRVDSKPGKGSTFSVFLPKKDDITQMETSTDRRFL